MILRTLRVHIKQDELYVLTENYATRVINALQSVPGCRYAGLLQSTSDQQYLISLTLWDNESVASQYERSDTFRNLIKETEQYFEESSEMELKLNTDLHLEYVHAHEEPVVDSYRTSSAPPLEPFQNLFLRMVSLKLRPGKGNDFKRVYDEHIIPLLLGLRGCRYAFLAERPGKSDEVISVTGWDNEASAEEYERKGTFSELLASSQHLLPEVLAWKIEFEKKTGNKVATSEDVVVERFRTLVGKSLK